MEETKFDGATLIEAGGALIAVVPYGDYYVEIQCGEETTGWTEKEALDVARKIAAALEKEGRPE